MNILLGYILTYTYLILIIFLVTLFKKKLNLNNETSRKLIHIFVGLSWFIMIYFFKSSYHLIIPPLTFILINYISYKKDIISAMERDEKNSKGTIYFAISYTILSIITVINNDFLPFYGIGALNMTFGDGIAPFIGKKFSKYKIGNTNKTYAGSLAIIIISIIISLSFNIIYKLNYTIIDFIILSFIACVLELIGKKGIDNLTLPIGVSIISYILSI